MKRMTSFVALAILAIAAAPAAWAQCSSPNYDYTIAAFNSSTPNDPPLWFSIGGSGVTGEHFSECQDSPGIQLGLRITNGADGYITPAGDDYVALTGANGSGNPKWNLDVSIDMGYAYGVGIAPNEVGDLDSLILQYDCEPAIGVVQGPAYDLVQIAGFFPLPLIESTQLIQLSDNLGFPGRCAGFEIDPDTPGAYEFSLTASYNGQPAGQATANAIIGEPPEVPVETENAAFTVIKTFEDFNTAEVEVELNCNTGLPLIQSQTISPIYVDELNNQVSFILSSLADSSADCTVSETPVPGYWAEYVDLTGTGTVDEDGCHYEDAVVGDSVLCGVINHVNPVEVVIEKDWQIEGEAANDQTYAAQINVQCYNIIGEAETEAEFNFWTYSHNGDTTFTAEVKPSWQGNTYCEVSEDFVSSGVEPSGCESDVAVNVGDEEVGCTLINTVFYEGIPTLNQYGLALLALLMLGMGFVGFRRFV